MALNILPDPFEKQSHRKWRTEQEETRFTELTKDRGFLAHLELAQDGGLDEVPDLYHPGRLLPAVMSLVLVCLNVTKVVGDDLRWLYLERKGRQTNQEYLSEELLTWCRVHLLGMSPAHDYAAENMVAVFELVGLLVLGVRIVHFVLESRLQKRPYFRWLSTATLFLFVLPDLKSFSAMRLLKWVQPYTLGREHRSHRAAIARKVRRGESGTQIFLARATWILARVVIFVLGFDAFLVKFRKVAPLATSTGPLWDSFLPIVLFLNQLMGIAQLDRMSLLRVVRFVFGGEDNLISTGEERAMKAWFSILYQTIWTASTMTPVKSFVVSMTFNDMDFQRLMLNEEYDDEEGPKRQPASAKLVANQNRLGKR